MASTQKKVILRRSDHTVVAGYLPAGGLLNRSEGTLDLLDTAGRIMAVPLKAVRYVAFVRDFNLADQENPERLARRVFLARPRTEGLWVRLTFRDGEVLEGLAPMDLSLVEDAMRDEGVYLTPPDVRSNTQRMYIPRSSLSAMQILAVVTTPSKAARVAREGELDLPFPEFGAKG